MMKGMSAWVIDVYEAKPMPRMENSVSVISAPENSPGSVPPSMVTSGMKVLRKAWRLMTVRSGTPLARAVRM